MTTGFLLIDKPADWTSFDIVAKLRTITGIKKIGHAGTLDPFATGLLIVAIGRDSTKRIDTFMKQPKDYEATFVLGATSTTQDSEGDITPTPNAVFPSASKIEAALNQFRGDIEQMPPMHSAIKINGRKLYELARKGVEIDRPPRKVTISAFDMLRYEAPELDVHIACSSGTYIRALARDLGQTLGIGAYTSQLRRTHIGQFSVKNSYPIAEVTSENWQSLLVR